MSKAMPLNPGTRIDSLRIDRVLGQGSFGVTYLVTDTVLDTSFALKEYLPRGLVRRGEGGQLQAVDDTARERFVKGLAAFLAEGRTAAGLEHPNVVRVFRCFEANGTAYLQMSWYRGEALHSLLKRGGTLNSEETLALARPLLDALQYMHGRGVVHRDIKPANVYVTQEGKPVLLDFGASGHSTAEALGSAGYAAPEQSGAGSDAGPQADIYGMAATLYRCVSGRIPPPAADRQKAFAAGEPDPLVPLDRLVPEAEFAGLNGAIAAGLAIDPGDRPGSAADWKRLFAPAGHAGLHTPVLSTEEESGEWLPRILLGAFIVAMAAALVYLFTVGDEPDGTPTGTRAEQAPGPVQSPEEEARWRSALNADTAYGYQQFMADYPESTHNDQAVLHLARLDHQAWGRARMDGTRGAIEAYLEQFPQGLHLADADILLNEIRLAEEADQRAREEAERQDEAAWNEARSARTVAALDAYLAAWPAGKHAAEARSLRSQLQGELSDRRAFEAAEKLHTRDAYQAYIDAFPRGASVAVALEAIDSLTLRPGKAFRDCADCPAMMVVPAGSFWQGSEEGAPYVLKKETPKRMVTIAEPFAIGVFEVTFAQWDRCVAEGGCSTNPGDNGWGRGQRPVIMVSWSDAQEFVSWLSNRTGQRYA